MTRRESIRLMAGATFASGFIPWDFQDSRTKRDYHVCLSPQQVLDDPDFPRLLRSSGVSCVWLAAYFYGHWPWSLQTLQSARDRLERAGLGVHIVNVPLGHPGDSLGSKDGTFPLSPPPHWRLGTAADARTHSGTSLHSPATEENGVALRALRKSGFGTVFLDDDFRLAQGPGTIGGCFCEDHKREFLQRTGFSSSTWPRLLDDIQHRRNTPLLRDWTGFTCDQLTGSFRAQRKASGGNLGIMVMYLGAEKAGIRLKDYHGVPLRVGELMFHDSAFAPIKGKTDELFSAMFHRRFVTPELAYSETTAYPADKLSAPNMAAKLVISTFADVRHTMFMSGIIPFPKSHWADLAQAMKQQARFHKVLAGHSPQGPFKHYWGESSRQVGTDQPFSLFLAAGIPFEVTARPARDGWTFLSDADAAAVAQNQLPSRGTRYITRTQQAPSSIPNSPPPPGSAGNAGTPQLEHCPESLEALFAFKSRLDAKTPFVVNNEPAVLAWYPTARAALLWNPSEDRKTFAIRFKNATREVTLQGLDSALLQDLV